MLAFIEDGYTEEGYIEAVEGIHPALSVKYRPAVPSEVNTFYRRIEAARPEEYETVAATWAAGRIISWDVRGSNGAPVFASSDFVARLRPKLFGRLLKCLRGEEAWDVDPKLAAAAQEQERQEREAAGKAGLPLAEWRARRDAKNSPTA